MIHNAQSLQDLRLPPANRLEKLRGDRSGQFVFASMIDGGFVFTGVRGMSTMWRLRIIMDNERVEMDSENRLAPVHPGEVLIEEFLKPFGLSQNRVARAIGVPPRRINEIVLGKRGISADTALRLGRYFGTSAQFWLGLQNDYDLDVARDDLGGRLEREVRELAEERATYNARKT